MLEKITISNFGPNFLPLHKIHPVLKNNSSLKNYVMLCKIIESEKVNYKKIRTQQG